MDMKIKKTLHKWESFSARGNKCPICKANFSRGCNHSVQEAKARLFENYITAIANTLKEQPCTNRK